MGFLLRDAVVERMPDCHAVGKGYAPDLIKPQKVGIYCVLVVGKPA
jgi:hypothetical protein